MRWEAVLADALLATGTGTAMVVVAGEVLAAGAVVVAAGGLDSLAGCAANAVVAAPRARAKASSD